MTRCRCSSATIQGPWALPYRGNLDLLALPPLSQEHRLEDSSELCSGLCRLRSLFPGLEKPSILCHL